MFRPSEFWLITVGNILSLSLCFVNYLAKSPLDCCECLSLNFIVLFDFATIGPFSSNKFIDGESALSQQLLREALLNNIQLRELNIRSILAVARNVKINLHFFCMI